MEQSFPSLLTVALFAPEKSTYRDSILTLSAIGTVVDQSRIELVGEVDLAIFVIHADRGISADEIATFQRVRELQLPTLILVASLAPTKDALDQWDFDDVMLLVNRVLEPSIAPFLVLHGEDGLPSGLFDLARVKVIDNTNSISKERDPESDLLQLTEAFRDEFKESGFGSADFVSGLTVVVLPYIPERDIGTEQVAKLLTTLQQARL